MTKKEQVRLNEIYAYRQKQCKICNHPIFVHTGGDMGFYNIKTNCIMCSCKFYKNMIYEVVIIGVTI